MLRYLCVGGLPWDKIKCSDKKKKYSLIYKMKREIKVEELCKEMPREFMVFLKYIQSMDFEEKPPYKQFKKMFEKLYISLGFPSNNIYEWE